LVIRYGLLVIRKEGALPALHFKLLTNNF
jgi:hypothetical protein